MILIQQMKINLKCVDFFCGGGGMSLGLSQAGIRVLGALDNDPDCRATYEANHPNSKFIQKDITKMKSAALGDELPIKPNQDDLVFVGCSPCQYWSIINGKASLERKIKSYPSRNLLGHFLRFVKYYRPGYVLVENVRGIVNAKNVKESGLSALLNFFDNNGYKYDDDILEACRYGVPQTRKRYVLIASRVDDSIELPKAENNIAVVKDKIFDLPKIHAGESPPPGDDLHRSSYLYEKNIKRLRLTPEGGRREHWAIKELLIPAYENKPLSFFRENYGRMSWNKPAPTITTKFFSLGCGRFGHPKQDRAISLREGALLQTFPKKYKFKTKSVAATARLIGNAVPPELARRLGKALMKAKPNG